MKFHSKLSKFFLKETFWCSFYLGLIPFRFDQKNQKFKKSKSALIYAYIINSITIILLIACSYILNQTDEYKVLLIRSIDAAIISIDVFLCFAAAFITIFRNWIGSLDIFKVFSKILKLEAKYLKNFKHDKNLNKICSNFIIFKGLTSTFVLILCIYPLFTMGELPSLNLVITTSIYILLSCFLEQILNQFCFSSLYLYRSFVLLNNRLQSHIKEINKKSKLPHRKHQCWMQRICDITDDIDDITTIYLRLSNISIQLQKIYQYQIFTFAILFLASNIQNTFLFCAFLSPSDSDKMNMAAKIAFLLIGIVSLIDFGCMFFIAEMVKDSVKSISSSILEFTGFKKLDYRLVQNIDALALIISCNKVRFRLFGFWELGHITVYHIIATSFNHFILLIQVDYDRFFGQEKVHT